LTIKTSFHWGGQNDPTPYVLRFNVEEMVREWLVSGPKRGEFLATVRSSSLENMPLNPFENFFLKKLGWGNSYCTAYDDRFASWGILFTKSFYHGSSC
jgi:Trafficking protein particle complex subunit 10, TRAPPC10